MSSTEGGSTGSRSPRGMSPSSTMLEIVEEIQFNEANREEGFQIHTDATDIQVHPSSEDQMNDSSPFHFNTIVDYAWDTQYSHGRLIATHLHSMFIAYVVKVHNVGAVRVIDMDSKERVLMKGDKGLIKDVDFLHKPEEIILGFIDEYGSYYVYKIIKELKTGRLTAHPVIKVALDGSPVRSENRRFIWCKYIPDELKEVATPKDCAYHYAVVQNDIIYAGNLVKLVQKQGEGTHQFHEIKDECLVIDAHSAFVTDASFAPDGTALATCSKDGTVKFFQIYFQEMSPARCLYSWAPHDGRPIDKIFFLDNHTIPENPSESQYWKFMITAANNCTEIKLFTCRSWACLQTIRFCTPDTARWKIEMSLTAKYMVATDIYRKTMYVLRVDSDNDTAGFSWIREFSMPWNVIGFNVNVATTLKYHEALTKGIGPSIVGSAANYSQDDILNFVEINVVQPRSLQQGSVAVKSPSMFSKKNRTNGHRRISFSQDISYKDLQDESGENDADDEGQGTVASQIESLASMKNIAMAAQQITPKRRSTSSMSPQTNKDTPSVAEMSEQLSSLIGLSGGLPQGRVSGKSSNSSRGKSTSPTHPHRPVGALPFGMGIDLQNNIHGTNGNLSKTSNSSSPSREVEEILSPKAAQSFVGRTSATGIEESIMLNLNTDLDLDLDTFENGNIPAILQMPDRKSPKPKNILGALGGTELFPQHVPEVLEKVNSLVNIISLQANEIKDLKKEVSRLTVMHVETARSSQDVTAIGQILDKHIQQNQNQLGKIEDYLRKMELSDKQKVSNSPYNQIPSNLAEVIASSVGNQVKSELEAIVPQALVFAFDPSRLNINTQIERLTSVVEAKLTQNIGQIMQRDKIWQSLSTNFQTITKSVFDSTFNDIFLNSVFPRCQSAVHEMLTQVNDTFMKGTKEYLTGLETVLERERRREDFQELIRQQMNSMQDALSSTLQVEVEAQMLRVLGGIQGGVVRQIEESMSRELARSFQDQQRYFEVSVGPRTVTPAVSVTDGVGGSDSRMGKRRVMEIARSGDIRGAFTQASSLGDADILLHLCKNFNATELTELNLPSQVHLSIMQLLASDIMEDTDVKINYLNTSILCLDMSDAKNAKGVARLIPVFQAAVSKFQDRNPNSPLIQQIRLLQMGFSNAGLQLKAMLSQSSQAQHSFSQFQQ